MTVGPEGLLWKALHRAGFTVRIGRDHGGGAGEALCQFGRAQAANDSILPNRQNNPNNPRRNPGVSAASGLTDTFGSASGPRGA